jgi:hypothetical protein
MSRENAYAFQRAELAAGKLILTRISNVKASQPTERSAVKGTSAYPLADTPGTMGLGEGSITFSDAGERQLLINSLGPNYREKPFVLTWIKTAPGRPQITHVCYGCKLKDEAVDDSEGADALGGEAQFSFLRMSTNGLFPHEGASSPTAGGAVNVPGVGGNLGSIGL